MDEKTFKIFDIGKEKKGGGVRDGQVEIRLEDDQTHVKKEEELQVGTRSWEILNSSCKQQGDISDPKRD